MTVPPLPIGESYLLLAAEGVMAAPGGNGSLVCRVGVAVLVNVSDIYAMGGPPSWPWWMPSGVPP